MEYSYPICKVHELIQYYKDEIGLEMIMDQFTNPTAEVWFNNYLQVVAKVIRLQPNELLDILRYTPANLEHSYLYENALVNIRFSLVMRKLLNNISCRTVNNFNLLDIKRPNKKSIVHTLSPILNFMRFQESQKESIDNILINERAELDKNVMLKDKVRILQSQLDEQNNRRMEKEKTAKITQSKDHELKEMVKANKTKLEAKRASYLKREEDKAELLAILERKTKQRDELRERSKSAASRIVQSPMRLQQNIQLQKSRQPELRQQYEVLRKELWQARELVRETTEARDAAMRMNERRREIEKTLIEIKEKKELHAKRRMETEEGFAQLDKLKRQAEQLDSENAKKRDGLNKTERTHGDKLAKILSDLNRFNLEDVRMKEATEKKKKEMNLIVERIEGITKQIKAEKEIGEAMCNKIVKSLMDYQESATKEILSKNYEDVERDVDKWIAENSEK